jgi:membrane fusion protein (multidrug efflux system)
VTGGKISIPNRRRLIYIGGAVAILALIIWIIEYLLVGQYYVSTDDAYIAADTALLAPKVGGYVTQVLVNENQLVKQGQLLMVVDPRDYQAALDGAEADIAAAQAAIASDQAQLSLQQAKILAATAMVQADQARETFAQQDRKRYEQASATGASTEQSTSQANTDVATAAAALAADRANLLGAQRQVQVLNAAAAQSQASLDQARARAQEAALDLSHTRLTAPFDGMIGDKTVQVGDYMQPGTEVMALVPLNQVYVLANFKETQITDIHRGQPVTITVDGYPGLHVTGTVDSVSPASGQEFALLPPDNATGNFTKIVQRVPVKIDVNLDATLIGKLRPGMSVEPSIDTRGASETTPGP